VLTAPAMGRAACAAGALIVVHIVLILPFARAAGPGATPACSPSDRTAKRTTRQLQDVRAFFQVLAATFAVAHLAFAVSAVVSVRADAFGDDSGGHRRAAEAGVSGFGFTDFGLSSVADMCVGLVMAS
jgi:hypothetical protein